MENVALTQRLIPDGSIETLSAYKQIIDQTTEMRRQGNFTGVTETPFPSDHTRLIVNSARECLGPSITCPRRFLINVSQKDFKSGKDIQLSPGHDIRSCWNCKNKIHRIASPSPVARNKGVAMLDEEVGARMQCQESGKSDNETSSL